MSQTIPARGPLFAPAWHRPWLRYIDPVDGAEGGNGDTTDAGATDGEKSIEDQLAEARADAEKWKGLSRKHEAAAKKTAMPAATPTGGDDTAAAIEELRRELASSKHEALVARVAAAKGIPAELLRGDDEDALNAFADSLLAFQKGAARPAPPANDDGASGKRGEPIGGGKQLTAAQALDLSPAERQKAIREGRLAHLGFPAPKG